MIFQFLHRERLLEKTFCVIWISSLLTKRNQFNAIQKFKKTLDTDMISTSQLPVKTILKSEYSVLHQLAELFSLTTQKYFQIKWTVCLHQSRKLAQRQKVVCFSYCRTVFPLSTPLTFLFFVRTRLQLSKATTFWLKLQRLVATDVFHISSANAILWSSLSNYWCDVLTEIKSSENYFMK